MKIIVLLIFLILAAGCTEGGTNPYNNGSGSLYTLFGERTAYQGLGEGTAPNLMTGGENPYGSGNNIYGSGNGLYGSSAPQPQQAIQQNTQPQYIPRVIYQQIAPYTGGNYEACGYDASPGPGGTYIIQETWDNGYSRTCVDGP